MSQVLILSMPSVCLVFGLDWLPLINGRANRVVYRMARQYRATHLVFVGDTAAAVGLAALKPSRAQRKKILVSAAQNVARLFPGGTIALLLELDPVSYWLVAVHDGAVVARTDRLYRCAEDGKAALEELRRSYPQLAVLGTASAPKAPALPDIEAASTAHTQLIPARRWRSILPVPVQWFVLSLLIVPLAPRAWQIVNPIQKMAASADPVDPVRAWADAIAKAGRHRVLHGVAGTRFLLNSLYELPTHLAGWSLVQAACAAEHLIWRCRAHYDRQRRDASNDGLLAIAPKNWVIPFTSIDRAEPMWEVVSPGMTLAAYRLRSTAYNERYLFSSLQMIKPAFTQMQLGKPQALNVTSPRDGQGKNIPRPAGLPLPLTRTVQISGPLRSGSLLAPYTESIGWRKVSISLRNTDTLNLKSSRINVSFQGELYETEMVQNNGSGIGQPDPRMAGPLRQADIVP